MSATQIGWLTNHFEQGKITQDEFTALYERIRQAEKDFANKQDYTGNVAQGRVARLHPETRRTLARVRCFKKLVKLVNYTMLLAIISVVYLAAEHYQVTGTMPSLNIAGLEKLLTQEPLKPLPSDIKLAAEYLAGQSRWDEQHVNQFLDRWHNTLLSERQRFSGEHWFQGLKLALSLHIVEQRKLAKTGNGHAIKQAVLLTQMAEQLEEASA